jgi:hypothetical protein
MDTETEKIIKKQMEILPEEIRNLFIDPKTNERVLEIGKKHEFSAEQLSSLQLETFLLMLCLTHPDQYRNELRNGLKINDETLNKIVNEIKDFLSNGIVEKLKETYKKTEERNREEKTQFEEKTKGEISLLPKEKQEIINGFGWEKIAEEIGKNHKLSEDEISVLKEEIILVLIESEDQDYFWFNIEDNTNVKQEEAKRIAEEVEQKIFKPMFDLLTKNIKNTLKIRNIHWRQNLDFILSGGDYTAFIRRVEEKKEQNVLNIKNTFNPSKLDDLKSKFTI